MSQRSDGSGGEFSSSVASDVPPGDLGMAAHDCGIEPPFAEGAGDPVAGFTIDHEVKGADPLIDPGVSSPRL